MFFNFNQKKNLIVPFLSSLMLFCIIYRTAFLLQTYQNALKPLHFQIAILSFGLLSDLLACIFSSILIYLIAKIAPPTFAKLTAWLFYLLFVFIYLINLKIFTNLYMGITYTLLMAYFYQGISSLSLFGLVNFSDFIFFILSLSIYQFVRKFSQKKLLLYCLLPIYFIFIMYGAGFFQHFAWVRLNNRLTAIYRSPINQIIYTFSKTFNKFNRNNYVVSTTQLHSIHLIDPLFANNPPNPIIQTTSNDRPWNIVIFVLESVGSKYIFEKINQRMPMPFLYSLSNQGTWFDNHYSGGNISALGQFSILTGIYPNPTPIHFELQDNLFIPTMPTWLGKNYDSFFVTASNNVYASKSLSETFAEYDNADVIHPNLKNLFFNMFMDEHEAFQFFKNRLIKAKTPFIGLYWSTATHYPYQNYGLDHHNIADPGSAFGRYINNLNLIDNEIQQTYLTLKNKKLLDHTVLIVVGDHGELFGQHDNLRAHGRSLYTEEIKVPLLIYAPKLIAPKKIDTITSSIDILPTLLDALHIHYGNQLQGESLLRASQRNYVFIYGDHDELAAIDKNNNKMVISFAENTCVAYDLNKDPGEIHPRICMNKNQQAAILKFRNYQPTILYWYNHLCNISLAHS